MVGSGCLRNRCFLEVCITLRDISLVSIFHNSYSWLASLLVERILALVYSDD